MQALFSRRAIDQELDDELRYHVERQMDENIAAGMSHKQARRAALRSIEGFDQKKEECRDMRGVNLIDDLLQDFRFAIRQLRKNLGFTATAICMLALGMCASVSIFAFVDAALIKALPYPNTARLVGVFGTIPLCPQCNVSYPDYLDLKKLNTVFSSLEVYNRNGFLLSTSEGLQPARGARVSDGFFRTLGITPVLGRDFYTGEDLPGA